MSHFFRHGKESPARHAKSSTQAMAGRTRYTYIFLLYLLTSLSLRAGETMWWGGSPRDSSPHHNPFQCGKTCRIYHHNVRDYHHNVRDYHHNVRDYHHNIHNYHCNVILVDYHHSVVVAAGNDTTHHDTLSLETSARHDKGGYSSYPRAMPSTMAGVQGTFTKFFFYIFYLLTTTTAATDDGNSCQRQWGLTPITSKREMEGIFCPPPLVSTLFYSIY